MDKKVPLFTKNFAIMVVAIFLMFFAFNMVMPIIAMYLIEQFNADVSVAGIVVSIYVITALMARPFSGYLVDKYDRKKLYLIVYSVFTLLYLGYIFAASILMFAITRVLLGATFAIVSTSGSTLSIDVMPSERRNEGIGYFGAFTVLAMAAGPMFGLYLMENVSYQALFIVAMISCTLGVIVASLVKTKPRPKMTKEPLSLDRFFLKSATSMAVVIAGLYFMYGALMAYVQLYLKEQHIEVSGGQFFLFLALGIVISRLISGRLLGKGMYSLLLNSGFGLLMAVSVVFIFFLNSATFVISSLLMGVAFGLIAPSVQSMIVALVDHSKRGTANSTYYIALDLGSGMGMFLGGFIASTTNYKTIYIISLVLVVLDFIYYKFYAQKNYNKHIARAEKVQFPNK